MYREVQVLYGHNPGFPSAIESNAGITALVVHMSLFPNQRVAVIVHEHSRLCMSLPGKQRVFLASMGSVSAVDGCETKDGGSRPARSGRSQFHFLLVLSHCAVQGDGQCPSSAA